MKTIINIIIIVLMGMVLACKPVKNVSTPIPKDMAYKALKEYKGDTLSYLQDNFIKRKNEYIGKELNVLFNDMELNIVECLPSCVSTNRYISPSLYIGFYSFIAEDSEKTYSILVKWQEPMKMVVVNQFVKSGKWKNEADCKSFFGKQKVKSIELITSNPVPK